MEISSRLHQERGGGGGGGEKYPSSPTSNATIHHHHHHHHHHQTPPLTPKNTITPRSDPNNPYPTTFVQADTHTFKQVVQMLTGSSSSESTTPKTPSSTPSSSSSSSKPLQPQQQQDPLPPPSSRNFSIPPIRTGQNKKQQQQQQGFKLYERRNSLIKNSLIINTLNPNFPAQFSPRNHHHNNNNKMQEILSPSLLDFPSLALSPVTPLNDADDDDPFDNKSSPEEEKAIAEKGFYLHPSPMTTPREAEPQLLPLFPLTSPRVSQSPSSSQTS